MQALSPPVAALADLAHPDGGWGYAPGQIAQIEPTCLAMLAQSLSPQRGEGEAVTKAWDFLQRCRRSDGSYRHPTGRDEAAWPTALVCFTYLATGHRFDLESTAAFLLHVQGKAPDAPEAGEMTDINLKLTGWPWAEGNFSWVEPTAWAVLALHRAGYQNHPRVQEGIQMLLDRAMDEGGINYGNRRILGKLLEPIPTPTALMLLALQGIDHPRIAAAVRYLIDQTTFTDVEHLCWTKIALDLYRHVPGVEEALVRLDEQIEEATEKRRQTPWLRPAPLREALTLLALRIEEKNMFGKPQDELANPGVQITARPKDEPVNLGGRKPSLGQRLGNWFKGLAAKAVSNLRPFPVNSSVHIARAPSYDANLVEILRQQYRHFAELVPLRDKRVVLKPNLVEYHRDKVINTDPRVVGAVIELCKSEGAREVIVAEGPGHWRNVEFLVEESGLGDVLRQHQVPFVDINHDEPIKRPNLGRLTGLDCLYLSRTIATAEVLISLPKLKTHHWAGATLSMKNLFGTLPGICYGWPKNELHWRGIDNSIVDIALTRTPDLAIVDGIIGMEGDGPLNGTAKPLGALIMGHDLVAVDATCCRLMHLDPEQIGYLVLGHAKKLGRIKTEEIPQLGELIETLAQPFATVPHLDKLRVRKSA